MADSDCTVEFVNGPACGVKVKFTDQPDIGDHINFWIDEGDCIPYYYDGNVLYHIQSMTMQ